MTETTEITAFYNRKVQLDDFEPVQHGVELHAELSEGDDLDEAYDELADQAEEMVERALASRITRKKMAASDDE